MKQLREVWRSCTRDNVEKGRALNASSFDASLLQEIDGVMSLALCRSLFQRLSPPGNRWCDVLCLLPTGWCLKHLNTSDFPRRKPLVTVTLPTPIISLTCHFLCLLHVEDSASTAVFENGGQCCKLVWTSLSTVHFK